MPNRILREGILTSERVNRLSWEGEVFYRRLMSVVDDFGRFHAHPALLRAALYPLKLDTVRDSGMERLLADVEQARLVRLYEASGKRYLELQDFRQHVRAKDSKFPPPPEESGVDAVQMHCHCAASAPVGGGVDVCEGEGVSEGEGDGGAGGVVFKNASAAPPAYVQLAIALREQGVAITSAHPKAKDWAGRGVTIAQALQAVSIARLRKPQGPIAPNYLAPILEEILHPPAGSAAKREPAWWASEAATLAKGRELGLAAHPGEAMADFRGRISAALEKKKANP